MSDDLKSEILKCKSETETAIQALVVEFYKKTGLVIDYVDINLMDVTISGAAQRHFSVNSVSLRLK